MRLSSFIPTVVAFSAAALIAVVTAILSVGVIERLSYAQISQVLADDGHDWTDVTVDGLQVTLTGTAPDEATRFRALSRAGTVIDASRVIDAMQVTPSETIAPPRFSIEILRNDDGISLIGLVPGAMDRAAVRSTITDLAGGAKVTDLMDAADYPVPGGWAQALSFALDALAKLPRSKISVAADEVRITAISGSTSEKRSLETSLSRLVPDGVRLVLDISAPRPVISPFTLRFLIDDSGGRFDACTAHTEDGRASILAAAAAAGLQGKANCPLGLGVPSPHWPDAVVAGINALAELGGGSITFSDADVSLVALETADQGAFDRIVGQLEADLPEVFSLSSELPEPVKIDGTGEGDGPPEFVATLSPEGLLQLRGRINDERLRNAVEGFARAKIGGAEVDGTMRLDPALPQGWSTRVFAAVEAMSLLSNGSVVVQPDFLEIKGNTGNAEAKAEISRILSDQLGGSGNFAIDVRYEVTLDPEAGLPTPEECIAQIEAAQAVRKLTFAPGSVDIEAVAIDTIDKIAEVLNDCTAVPIEIGGHTDSQGRETMNQQLSQQRADAVLTALLARRVLTANMTAKGYGEAEPIANNDTDAGREANRRIEFKLRLPEPDPEAADVAADAEAEAAATAEDAQATAETDDSPETSQTETPSEQN